MARRRRKIDFREKATSSEEEIDTLGVSGIDGKDITERGRRKEMRTVVINSGFVRRMCWMDGGDSQELQSDGSRP